MEDDIQDYICEHGPKTVREIAEYLQADTNDVSLAVAGMIIGETVRLEPLDGKIWYIGAGYER